MSDDRARITAGELAIVCSHYDLGDVRKAQHFKAGSRASPKALLVTSTGAFLLKRRASPSSGTPRADWLHRIALSHQIVLHLASRGLPVPALIGTRKDQNSMLQCGEQVYEIYRFVRGRAYDRTADSAYFAGDLLSRCHRALRELRPEWPPPRRSYHAHPQLPSVLRNLHSSLGDPVLQETAVSLADRYERAAAYATSAGVSLLADQLVHNDWHPGNLLWAEAGPTPQIAAILDFDTVSLAPAITDAANGALQFAFRRRPIQTPRPGHAPFEVEFDAALYTAFWRGYHAADPAAMSWPIETVPWLCIESIIAEAVIPIAATGFFGRFAPLGVLRLANRTAAWFESHAQSLARRATNP